MKRDRGFMGLVAIPWSWGLWPIPVGVAVACVVRASARVHARASCVRAWARMRAHGLALSAPQEARAAALEVELELERAAQSCVDLSGSDYSVEPLQW